MDTPPTPSPRGRKPSYVKARRVLKFLNIVLLGVSVGLVLAFPSLLGLLVSGISFAVAAALVLVE